MPFPKRSSRSLPSATFLSVTALALAAALAGCSGGSAGVESSTAAASNSAAAGSGTASAEIPAAVAEDTHFDADDLEWDAAKEIPVTLADGASTAAEGISVDGNTVTITAKGTYRLSGSLSDGRVEINAGDEVVRVILDGVDLANSSGSPFVVTSANEAIVYLAEGSSNTFSDAGTYADTGEDAPNAALYSAADLTIAGPGALSVTGNFNDAINTKDGLVLASGNVTAKAVDDGIRGKDYTVLLDGTTTVTAAGDGIKADNDTDEGRGWMLISGGTVTVDSGDDALKAANLLTITGGAVTVTDSVEALEAAHIAISGGTVDVTSSDDGINAAGGTATATGFGGMGGGPMEESSGDYTVLITGGSVTINADGDGLDSNGSATISGGTVVVNGPTNNGNGALDVNGELKVDGGVLAAGGSSGMAVAPGSSSTQSGVQVTFSSPVAAGTPISLVDAAGNVVSTFVPTKTTASLVFSSAAVTAGETYTVYTGGSADVAAGVGTASVAGATQAATVVAGQYSTGGGMGGGMGGGGRPGA